MFPFFSFGGETASGCCGHLCFSSQRIYVLRLITLSHERLFVFLFLYNLSVVSHFSVVFIVLFQTEDLFLCSSPAYCFLLSKPFFTFLES